MSVDKYQSIPLAGIGNIIGQIGGAANTTNQPLFIGKLENANLRFNATVVKKFAGKGAFPAATYTPEKEITMTADNAFLSLQQIRMSQGDEAVGASIYRSVTDESLTIASGAATGAVAKAAFVAGKTVVFTAAGTRLDRVTGAPATTGEYNETTASAGVLTFHADLTSGGAASLVVHYVYTYDASTNADALDMGAFNSTARACEFALWYNHNFTECSKTRICEIFFWQARPTGELEVAFTHGDFARVTGAAFEIEDSQRADNEIGYIALKNA